ncbi:XVIPCD domain-containing protein [Lysobacter firmicutimachus]|uniref:XVIPCD domain-containing protein n=1 Tax=Lysobacter firmicutimachus TaxID=1792846 RepID=A0AAU8MMR9_9GAMM
MNANAQEPRLAVPEGAGTQTLDDLRRAEQRNLLSSPSHPHHDFYAQVRVCLDKQDALRSYPTEQRDNLAAALALEARAGGLRSVDHVALSRDGARSFAVEGEPDAPGRRIAHVDTAQAAAQSMERTTQLFAQLERERQLQELQRDQERRPGRDEPRDDRHNENREERREPSLMRSLFKDRD